MSSAFLCHSSADKPFVRRLASDLILSGARVWVDEAELLVGDKLLSRIASAIEDMEFLVAVLSPSSVNSPWVAKELELAMNAELQKRGVKVLPVVAAACPVPAFLKDTFFLKMDTDDNYRRGLANLLRRLFPEKSAVAQTLAATSAAEGFGWVRNVKRRNQLLSNQRSERLASLKGLENSRLAVPIALELLGDRSVQVVEAALEVLKSVPYGEGAWISLSGEDQYIPFGDDVVEGNTIVHYDLGAYLAPIYEYLEQNLLPRQTLLTLLAAATVGPRLSRAIALFTMGAARHEAAIPILVSASITEEDDVVREIAVWSLSEISESRKDDPRILNTLLLSASDLIGNVRYRAALGLSRTAGEDAKKMLSEMLNDRSPKIVKLAIEALGNFTNNAVFDSLSRFLRSHRGSSEYVDDLLKTYAVISISKQRGHDVEAVLLELLSQVRYASAFDARDRSGKYVAALCLRELRAHATSASVPVVNRFASVKETVNVPTNLGQSSGYWPIAISDSVAAILGAVAKDTR